MALIIAKGPYTDVLHEIASLPDAWVGRNRVGNLVYSTDSMAVTVADNPADEAVDLVIDESEGTSAGAWQVLERLTQNTSFALHMYDDGSDELCAHRPVRNERGGPASP